MKLFETQQKATVITACWHSNGGSLPIVRRWSSASSDRNLKQPYLIHWFQLRREEIPSLLFALIPSSLPRPPFSLSSPTLLFSYFLQMFFYVRCVCWRTALHHSISIVLYQHVIKESYVWIREQDRGRSRKIALIPVAIYIHWRWCAAEPKQHVCGVCLVYLLHKKRCASQINMVLNTAYSYKL